MRGAPVGRVAAMLSLSVSYVSKVLSRRRLSGETTARPQRCHVPRKLAGHLAALRERVETRPDATIEELRFWLRETRGVLASATLVWEALGELTLTLKKRPCMPPSRTVRTLPRRARPGARSSRA
jgi:transposase